VELKRTKKVKDFHDIIIYANSFQGKPISSTSTHALILFINALLFLFSVMIQRELGPFSYHRILIMRWTMLLWWLIRHFPY